MYTKSNYNKAVQEEKKMNTVVGFLFEQRKTHTHTVVLSGKTKNTLPEPCIYSRRREKQGKKRNNNNNNDEHCHAKKKKKKNK